MKTSVSQSIEAGKQTPQEFAKTHWKEILAVSGTLAGAVILLLIRYHRKRRTEEGDISKDPHLDALEGEATGDFPETVMWLETGVAAKDHIPGSDEIITQLEEGLPSGKARKKMRIFKSIRS